MKIIHPTDPRTIAAQPSEWVEEASGLSALNAVDSDELARAGEKLPEGIALVNPAVVDLRVGRENPAVVDLRVGRENPAELIAQESRSPKQLK